MHEFGVKTLNFRTCCRIHSSDHVLQFIRNKIKQVKNKKVFTEYLSEIWASPDG